MADGRSLGEPRNPISRPAPGAEIAPGGISAARGASSGGRRIASAEETAAYNALPAPSQAQARFILDRSFEISRQWCSQSNPYGTCINPPSVTPTAPGVLLGDADPSDTLSDVFRSLFGSDAAPVTTQGQQALTPVTTGGGGSPLMLILILGAVGFAVYWFFIRKRVQA